jgi:hypothetical protein
MIECVPGLGEINETESRLVYRVAKPPQSIESQVHRDPEGGPEEELHTVLKPDDPPETRLRSSPTDS